MEYNLSNKTLLDEITFWRTRNPFYENIFRKLSSLIILVDIYLEEDKLVDNNVVIDFVAGIALLGLGLSKKNDKTIQKSEIMIAPLLNLIKKIVTSESYRKALLKDSMTGGRTLNISIGKSTLTIPINIEEIEKFISKDTVLINKEDVDSTIYNFIENENEKFANLTIPKKERLRLEDMFVDIDSLYSITQTLTNKGFVKNGVWQGKTLAASSRNPKEKLLAALVMRLKKNNYLKINYTDKELSESFREYFKLKSRGHYFKYGQREEVEQYLSLFNFL